MATAAPKQPTQAVQVDEEKSKIDYYDLLVIGSAGRGKTTTADKLLVANPTGHDYGQPVPLGGLEVVVDEENQQLRYTDITMWLGTSNDEFETHLKFLDNCRKSPNPHMQVNRVRSTSLDESTAVFQPTKQCEVLSNETSKVRVMDVPGFFDGASILNQNSDQPLSPTESLNVNNLGIMRMIIRIQTTLAMKFNRILYFLPGRGPLERADAVLKLELNWMAHFFGRAIFKSMVLVATVPATFSEMELPDDKKFPDRDVQITKKLFRKALEETFRSFSGDSLSEDPLPDPPLIFISQTNTCEEILEKIKRTTVTQEGLYLKIDPNTCSQCGVKIGVVKGQRVTCYFGEDLMNGIPYEESTCHPYFIPKYTRIDKIWSGFMHFVSLKWMVGKPWPVLIGEKCVACEGEPNRQGCMQVRQQYMKKKKTVTVDHTNQVPNEQPGECADEEAEDLPPPVESGQNMAQNGSARLEHRNSSSSEAVTQQGTPQAAGGVPHTCVEAQGPSNVPHLVMNNPTWETKGT